MYGKVNIGSENKYKLKKITISETTPTAPQLHDVWVKCPNDNYNVVFDTIDYPINDKDLLIKYGGIENTIQKTVITKDGVVINIIPIPSTKLTLYSSDTSAIVYIPIIARLKKDGLISVLNALYYDGTKWVSFSDIDEVVYIETLSTANTNYLTAFSTKTDTINATIQLSTLGNPTYCFDRENKLVYFINYSGSKYTIRQYDKGLNFIKQWVIDDTSFTLDVVRGLSPTFVINERLFYQFSAGSTARLYSMDLNTLDKKRCSLYDSSGIIFVDYNTYNNVALVRTMSIGEFDNSYGYYVIKLSDLTTLYSKGYTIEPFYMKFNPQGDKIISLESLKVLVFNLNFTTVKNISISSGGIYGLVIDTNDIAYLQFSNALLSVDLLNGTTKTIGGVVTAQSSGNFNKKFILDKFGFLYVLGGSPFSIQKFNLGSTVTLNKTIALSTYRPVTTHTSGLNIETLNK